MDNIFYRVLLNDRIKVAPKYLSKEFRSHIVKKLKEGVEGVCSKHGYVKTDSIELYKVTPGNIELISLNGNIVFDVYYYADVCNPLIGNTLKAKVTNVNKFGILAESSNILEIIIAKNSVNIVHDTQIDLEQIQIGDTIMVEVLGKKFELNDKKISIVGKVVSGTTSTGTKLYKKKEKEEEEEEDVVDTGDAVDVIEGGRGDAEENESGDEGDNDSEDSGNNESELGDFEEDKNEFFDSDDGEFIEEEYEFYSEEIENDLDDNGDDDYED
jgi:DNA-directed RNA polymerase subunit E'/Rpb7